jgi:hypothetical protein
MKLSPIALIAVALVTIPTQAQAETPKEFGPWRQQLESDLWAKNDGLNPIVLKRFKAQTEDQQLLVYRMAKTTCSLHREKVPPIVISKSISKFVADNSDKPGFETANDRKQLTRLFTAGHRAARSTFCKK